MNRWIMASVYLLTVLVVAACAKGRYTDDHHYVGNPERIPATSESSTRDRGERIPADTSVAPQ